MAYIQTPGRGNKAKTGNGLPTSLNNGSAGNQEGYNPVTSPLPNTVNKGGYEKTLDTTNDLVILRGGDKKEISRARKNSPEADEITRKFNVEQTNTNTSRSNNTFFLESKKNIGVTAR